MCHPQNLNKNQHLCHAHHAFSTRAQRAERSSAFCVISRSNEDRHRRSLDADPEPEAQVSGRHGGGDRRRAEVEAAAAGAGAGGGGVAQETTARKVPRGAGRSGRQPEVREKRK